jgi:hypothetical protein
VSARAEEHAASGAIPVLLMVLRPPAAEVRFKPATAVPLIQLVRFPDLDRPFILLQQLRIFVAKSAPREEVSGRSVARLPPPSGAGCKFRRSPLPGKMADHDFSRDFRSIEISMRRARLDTSGSLYKSEFS